jgi:(E)-4-hydroxy-3-methylbut-2-enyl-diphosphate synthase
VTKIIKRFLTREVTIGDVPLGGKNPVRVQSMTTTNTMDIIATVEQSIRIIQAGADYVRITAPSIKEAENLGNIKNELTKRGYRTPLIADIHYTPNAAEVAARLVEKVRINPGNYIDKKKFEFKEYTDSEYSAELERLREKFLPLVKICKEYGTAMRIGTNHGSLSDRIMSRFGDTPQGMVESAMEFLKICEDENFYNIVLSMKASNPTVMLEANRLLVRKMCNEGMNYPIHLGVTEAGEGEDGRIKSAVGIGTLLEEGIGDTVRVSLTEEPEFEIPVCKLIVSQYEYDGYYEKYENKISKNYNAVVPKVILSGEITYENLKEAGYDYNKISDKWNISDAAADYLVVEKINETINLPSSPEIILKDKSDKDIIFFNPLPSQTLEENILQIKNILKAEKGKRIFLHINYGKISEEEFIVKSSIDAGGLLIEGYCDGLWLEAELPKEFIRDISFGILQAVRRRISRAEYISCPSCGRTLFNLQETTAKIRQATSHLKGLKIAVMGCIVNGPGEMADADYGYVGSGIGKITLYKKKEIVRRNIPSESALEELIQLIKENGDWQEEK